nr:hypothetical protein [uncultured Acetatifactor sp.]
MFLIENQTIGLEPYTHQDDYDMYLCWKDVDTQKGYNGIFDQTLDEFRKTDISRFKFWVTAIDKNTGERVGTLRLGLDETCPDLAIWIYPNHRNQIPRCKQRGINLATLQSSGVFDPRGIRQLAVQARPLGSLLAGIKDTEQRRFNWL